MLEDPFPELGGKMPTWSDQVLIKITFIDIPAYFVCQPRPGRPPHFRLVATSSGLDIQLGNPLFVDLLRTTDIWKRVLDEREQPGHFLKTPELKEALLEYLAQCTAFLLKAK